MDSTAYFQSRKTVAQDFANQLADLVGQDTAILALSKGGAVMGLEIAKRTHSLVGLLLLKHIYLPGENSALGVVDTTGSLTYGENISKPFIDEFEMEYRGIIEQDKMEASQELHAVSKQGKLSPHYFNDKTVIMVNDFTKTGTSFKAAADFLKPIKTRSLILVTAIASTPAIDMMHLLGDKIFIAHTTTKDLPPEHYFAENDIEITEELTLLMQQMPLKW